MSGGKAIFDCNYIYKRKKNVIVLIIFLFFGIEMNLFISGFFLII